MIAKIKSLFQNTEDKTVLEGPDLLHVATAALLVEASMSDEEYSEAERATILALLSKHFDLSDDEAMSVVEAAEEAHGSSDQLLGFTRTIKDEIQIDDRVSIIEMLWEIAYSDGVLNDYEAHLVRRICGLIYVSDVDSGSARKRVLQRLRISE